RGYSMTLGWYLASMWLLMLALTMVALSSFIYLLDVIDLLKEVSGHGVSSAQAAFMSLAKLPDLMMQLLPFAVLLASLLCVNALNRREELVALRASGLPARRIVLGPVLACLFVGSVALFVGNPVASTLLKRYENWRADVMPNSVKGIVTSGGNIWLRQDEVDDG